MTNQNVERAKMMATRAGAPAAEVYNVLLCVLHTSLVDQHALPSYSGALVADAPHELRVALVRLLGCDSSLSESTRACAMVGVSVDSVVCHPARRAVYDKSRHAFRITRALEKLDLGPL